MVSELVLLFLSLGVVGAVIAGCVSVSKPTRGLKRRVVDRFNPSSTGAYWNVMRGGHKERCLRRVLASCYFSLPTLFSKAPYFQTPNPKHHPQHHSLSLWNTAKNGKNKKETLATEWPLDAPLSPLPVETPFITPDPTEGTPEAPGMPLRSGTSSLHEPVSHSETSRVQNTHVFMTAIP